MPVVPVAAAQQRRVQQRVENIDACGFFNLLTGAELLDDVESLLPEHRERLFPPTETLAMFMAQALSADGSCRQAVDDAAVKRLVAGLFPNSTNTAAYCKARARLPETLRCRSPEMVRKELWVYLLAYNLIRLLMAQAALLADQVPRHCDGMKGATALLKT